MDRWNATIRQHDEEESRKQTLCTTHANDLIINYSVYNLVVLRLQKANEDQPCIACANSDPK
jgi:hypothetical protein